VRYGSFARSFTLPEGVKAEDVKATYRHGVLELAIPLPESMVPRKVSIQAEGPTDGQKQIGASR
jgi:HSP20 family protein